MNKIITQEEISNKPITEIRYTFVLDVPSAKSSVYNNETTLKISGVVSWPNGSDIKKIQADLERRYNEAQQRLNEANNYSPFKMSYDGVKWLSL
jgi:hypothetical protein